MVGIFARVHVVHVGKLWGLARSKAPDVCIPAYTALCGRIAVHMRDASDGRERPPEIIGRRR